MENNNSNNQEPIPQIVNETNQEDQRLQSTEELGLVPSSIQDNTASEVEHNPVDDFNMDAEAIKQVNETEVQEEIPLAPETVETTAPSQQVDTFPDTKPVAVSTEMEMNQSVEAEKPNQLVTENNSTGEGSIIVNDLLGATTRQIERLEDKIATEKGWGEDVSKLEEELKGHRDMRDYLLGRDYLDKRDNVRDASTGQFKAREDTNNSDEADSNDQAYENLPLLKEDGLLDKWADAEDHNDKTAALDIQDEIFKRIEKENGMDEARKLQLIDIVDKEMNKRRRNVPEQLETATDESSQNAEEIEKQGNDQPVNENPEVENSDEQEIQVPEAPEMEANRRLALDKAIEGYAKAKLHAERLFSGKKDKIEFDSAAAILKTKFNEYMAVIPETMRVADQALANAREANSAEISEIDQQLSELNNRKNSAGEQYDGSLDSQINDLQAKLELANDTKKGIDNEYEQREGARQAYLQSRLMETSKNISQAVIDERIRSNPRMTKFMGFLRSHPKTRLAVSIGLTAAGFVGASTFDAPLVALATVGKGLLRGYGSYDLVQQLGERKAAKNVSQSELKTIDDYLASSSKEAATLRNYKRGGAVIGSILAVGPIAWSLAEGHAPTLNRPTHSSGTHPEHAPAPIEHPSTTSTLDIRPVDGNTLPWDYAMNSHLGNLSSRLPELINNHYGIHFVGNGLSGGQGAIESVTIPGQGTFTDLGHINGAIQFILGGGK